MNSSTSYKHIQLFDRSNLDSLPNYDTASAARARNFFIPLMESGINGYVENINTEMKFLTIDDEVLPITINEGEYNNSFVCSLYGQYITCAQESLHLIQNPILRKMVLVLLHLQGQAYKIGKLNKSIVVNSLLTSTNLYPRKIAIHINSIKKYLTKHFPEHAIIFRSLAENLHQDFLENLRKENFSLIASRIVFYTNTQLEETFHTRIFKSDLRHLEKSDYEFIDHSQISQGELTRILELYNNVYIDKHSKSNPRFTLRYLELALSNKFLHLKALKKHGQIDGVFGYYIQDGIMMAPFFGYDTTIPNSGLYRQLCTLLMLEAKEKGLILHQSSGASFYKKTRRAESCFEYAAVHTGHLPLHRRIPWDILEHTMNQFGVRFMKKH